MPMRSEVHGARRRIAKAQPTRGSSLKTITWLSPDDPPERFPPHERRCDDPPGCWRPAGICRPSGCSPPIERGIFPWYSPGQPVLWWSPDPRAVLLPRGVPSLAQPRQDAAQRAASRRTWIATSPPWSTAAPRRARAARAPGSPPRCAPPTCELHQLGPCPQLSRSGAPAIAWSAALRRAAGAGVLRRIDVQPRARCLQGRAGRPGGALCRRNGIERDRLPAALAPPAQPGQPRHPAQQFQACCAICTLWPRRS